MALMGSLLGAAALLVAACAYTTWNRRQRTTQNQESNQENTSTPGTLTGRPVGENETIRVVASVVGPTTSHYKNSGATVTTSIEADSVLPEADVLSQTTIYQRSVNHQPPGHNCIEV